VNWKRGMGVSESRMFDCRDVRFALSVSKLTVFTRHFKETSVEI